MRYEQIYSAPGKFSKPHIVAGKNGIHKQGCCDCGLVHDMKYTAWVKVHKNNKLVGYQKLSSKSVVVMCEARRNVRATYNRRHTKKMLSKKAK